MATVPLVTEFWENGELSLQKNSFDASESTASRTYVVRGAASERDAVSAAYAASPAVLEDGDGGRLPRKSASISERLSSDVWKVNVSYGHSSSTAFSMEEDEEYASRGGGTASLEADVCFQVAAPQTHFVTPLSQACVWRRSGLPVPPAPAAVPIGWNGLPGESSEVAGVDFADSGIHEQYDVVISYDKARSANWRRRVIQCCGKVNAGTFHGWNAGEVFFCGASYSTPRKGVEKVKVTFDFCIRPNEPACKVAGVSVGNVRGWEYPWVLYSPAGASAPFPVIDYVFVAQVFEYVDFDVLGV